MKDLGTYIQQHRIEAGYATQRAFADALGKDQSWVSRIERGVGKELPPPEDIELLASVLHVTPHELFIAAGYRLDDSPPPDEPIIRQVRAILEGKDLTDKQIGQLTRQVRGLVEMMEG